jgi:hypothetical protein
MTDEANRRGVGAVAEAMEGRTPERVAYAWPDLPGMMTIPFFPEPWSDAWWGLKAMAGAGLDGDEFNIGWFDNPQNTGWQRGPDARDPQRRAPVIAAMVERFGPWECRTRG